MKAIEYYRYGSPEVLTLTEVPAPVPADDEVLIRIFATAVSSGDIRVRKADPFAVRFLFGLLKPKKKILGVVLAGQVESIGKNVTKFKEGDQVYGNTGLGLGTYAEFISLSQDAALALKPVNLTYKEAAAIPFGGMTALSFLRKGKIQRGQKVLVYGASGAVGTSAVQLARHFGAEVTAVCSTANLEMVKALGAVKAIDYTKDDLSQITERYDIILDTVGKSPFSTCVNLLKQDGKYLRVVHMALSAILRGLWVSITSSKKVIGGGITETAEDLNFLKELVEAGKLRAVIDRSYSLEEIVEAHTYVEKGHKKGNVIVTINQTSK
jgi:NADPH:quinone reductase-like Zn-dependent oxidoreductase